MSGDVTVNAFDVVLGNTESIAENLISTGGIVTLNASASLDGAITISGSSTTFQQPVSGNGQNLDISGSATFQQNGTNFGQLSISEDLIVQNVLLQAAAPLVVQSGFNAQLSGTVDAPVVGQPGSAITATGNLILGDSSSAGFATAGNLFVNGFNVTTARRGRGTTRKPRPCLMTAGAPVIDQTAWNFLPGDGRYGKRSSHRAVVGPERLHNRTGTERRNSTDRLGCLLCRGGIAGGP